jgi:RNA polymerase primary sigma factor
LIKSNLRFVVHVAKSFQRYGFPLVDLISEGNIGLINAVERFDPSRGIHFVSYAVWWIRQSIIRSINEKLCFIRMPVHYLEAMRRLDKSPFTSEADKAGISDYKAYINNMKGPVSLETPIRQEDGCTALSECLEDTQYSLPEENTINSALREEIKSALGTLSEREAEVIKRRFGLENNNQDTLLEIGYSLNITKERVRQIEASAMQRLRSKKKIMKLHSFVA